MKKRSGAKATRPTHPRDRKTPGTTTLGPLELPTATVKGLDHYARRLTELLGIPATRADAAFLAIDKGLARTAKDFEALDAAKGKR
jgi:hypothetical protein